ncbi:MAG: branched-chain amino acid ABC transporter permease [Vulcanimicrobiaceae bacterium]
MLERIRPYSVYIVFALAILLPVVDQNQPLISFLADAGTYMMLALGLNIVVGFAGLLDLGYAAFFAIGSYSYAMLASGQFNIHIPFWVMIFVAAAIAATFGVLLGAPTLRLRGDYLAIVTLGFGEIVPQTFLNLTKYTNGPNGISPVDSPKFFGYDFGFNAIPYYYVAIALVALALVVSANLRSSRLGRAWMAIREDELAARHMGINTTFTKLAAFGMGASFSGLGGVAYAAKLQLVSPDQFSFSVSVLILSMLVLGGMGSLTGVVVGSFVLSTVNYFIIPQASNLAATYLHVHIDFTNYQFMLYGGILVAIMLFRPQGLVGATTRRPTALGTARTSSIEDAAA